MLKRIVQRSTAQNVHEKLAKKQDSQTNREKILINISQLMMTPTQIKQNPSTNNNT